MTVTNGYCTVPEAKQWVGLTDSLDDSLLEDIITAASRWIDEYCGRQFWSSTAGTARVFDSYDRYSVEIGAYSAVTLVKTDDNQDGVFETTWSASDYQLLPLDVSSPEPQAYTEIRAISTRTFPIRYPFGRLGLVQVTGTPGEAAVPSAVNLACRMQTSRMLQRRKSPEGVAGWGEFGVVRIGQVDNDVAALLAPYRIPAIA